MKKIIRLTESDLIRIVKRVINEDFVDDNEKLYNKISYSPDKITIKITEEGKEYIEQQLKGWLEQSRPSIQTKGFIPDYDIYIPNKVTLKRNYGFEFEDGKLNDTNIVKIGSIQISGNESGRRWIGLSPLTKTGEGNASSSEFCIYARYFPFENENGDGATIGITKGLYKKNKYADMQKVNHCEFDEIEVGEIDDRGWFEIVDTSN